jgi:aerobic-type carbon monoxide dehydrogenase small subunit (CoxS/CutS family)
MKLVRVAAAPLLVVSIAAGTALAGTPSHTLKFTTGQFGVNCTSTGELCSPAEKLKFKLQHPGTLTSVKYTTAATHCSTVQVHVLLNGHEVAKTGVLAAGAASEKLTTHIALAKGKNKLGFKAQGFVNGCNVGRVVSWGGAVTVTVKTG